MQGSKGVLGSRASRAVFGFYAAVLIVYAAPHPSCAKQPEIRAQVLNSKWVGGLITPRAMSILVWGSDGSIYLYEKKSGWTASATPVDADLTAMAVDDSRKVLVAVGEQGTLIRSDDGGKTWSTIEHDAADLRTVLYDKNSKVWIVAGARGAMLRSSDAGLSWQAIATEQRVTLQSLWADGAIFVGGEEGTIGISENAGKSWVFTRVPMPEPATPIHSFQWCGERLLATSALGRLVVFDDRGASWNLLDTGTKAFFTGAAWDAGHRSMVLTSHTGEIFVSDDACRTFKRIQAQGNYLSAIRYDERDRTLLAVGYHGTLMRSTDGGHHWTVLATKSNADIEAIVGEFVVGEGGLIARVNGEVLIPSLSLNLREVVSVPRSDVIVASGELGGVVHSEDSGATWKFVDIHYPDMNTPPNLRTLVIEPREGAVLAAGPPGTIIRSVDRGKTWQVRHWSPLEAQEAFPWSLVDTRRKQVVVLEAHGAMYRSHNGGADWDVSSVKTDREFWHGAVSLRDGIYIAAGQRGVVARSDDAGDTWAQVSSNVTTDLYGSFLDESTRTFYLLGAQGVMLRSSDGGLHWSALQTHTALSLRRMLRDPRSSALIVFGEKGGMLRSADSGMTWDLVATGTDAELRNGIVDVARNQLVVVGQHGVLLQSGDAGKTWDRLPSHTRRSFRSLALNERNGDIIAVGERIVRITSR